ncbi:hypothetical protein Tco_0189228 [Tanacetum coccineum]
MGYQKTPTLSSNNYKKNAGVGGSGRFGGSSGLSSNTYKQKTSVGASNSARYGGSSSLSTNGYKGRSSSYGGSKIVGSVGGSGGQWGMVIFYVPGVWFCSQFRKSLSPAKAIGKHLQSPSMCSNVLKHTVREETSIYYQARTVDYVNSFLEWMSDLIAKSFERK